MKMRPRYSVIASAVSLGFVLSKSVMALVPNAGSLNRELEQRQIQPNLVANYLIKQQNRLIPHSINKS